MLDAYIIPIEDAALAFILLSSLLLIPICVVHYRRFGYLRPTRAVVFYSFLFYALCAVALAILPLPELTPDFCAGQSWATHLQPVPLNVVAEIVAANDISLRHFNLISILESFAFLQAAFNFLLLLPLGFYLSYYFRAPFKVALAIAFATTLTFEVTQLTGIYGLYPCPYRLFDVDDLILNSSGAALGYAIAPLFGFLPDLQQRPRARPVRVSVPRRLVAFAIDWFLVNTISRLVFAPFSTSGDHSIWVDFVAYALWFIAIPAIGQGQTIGKRLVRVQITSLSGKPPPLSKLCLRYGLLVFLPVATEIVLNAVMERQLEALGYVSVSALFFLGLLVIEGFLLLGLMLFRTDHRGIHGILSKTQHAIAVHSERP